MRFLRPGWLVIYALIAFFVFGNKGGGSFSFDEALVIEDGDTLYSLVGDLGLVKKYKLKKFLKNNDIDTSRLGIGSYDDVVGEITFSDFFSRLEEGPSTEIVKLTLLEGWSTYDVDDFLTDEGLIDAGEYLSFVSNRDGIRDYFAERDWYADGQWSSDYEFLSNEQLDKGLEGVLYAETYHLDRKKDIISQLVRLQLETFAERVWTPYLTLDFALKERGLNLDWYDVLILASVVEKEERVDANRKKIAGVFYNRLRDDWRLDADITLCYGLETGYAACTPEIIRQNLGNRSNVYNTRALGGMPPTPIVTPTAESVAAVLDPVDHSYYFYLHDPQGRIHMAETNAEHEVNKDNHL